MVAPESFKRGDEVLSKWPGRSTMIVLAVEGLKVRCSDEQDRQYWFDANSLERCRCAPLRVATEQPLGCDICATAPLNLHPGRAK